MTIILNDLIILNMVIEMTACISKSLGNKTSLYVRNMTALANNAK